MPALNSIPGEPQVWLVGTQAYLVYLYDFDFLEGEIPLAFSITTKDLQAAFGGKPIVYNQRMSTSEFDQVGALDFGSSIGLATFDKDPMTTWMEDYETEAKVRPWLNDPEIAALTLGAYLEGREVTDAEMQGTEWWRTHNDAQRQWLLLTMSDPATATQLERDARINVRSMLNAAGVAHPGADVIKYMATEHISGNWSAVYLEQQINKLADPYAAGKLDKGLRKVLDGERPEGTQRMTDVVQSLYEEWLGPHYGRMSKAELERWSGRLRNDPDAQIELEKKLQKKRLALFPKFTDPTTTYEDIAGLYRGDWFNVLGRQPDEVRDANWISFLRRPDTEDQGQFLRNLGVQRGSDHMIRQAMRDTMGAFGQTRAPV